MKTRCVKCGRTDERKELILSEVNRGNLDIMVRNLDGRRIGRMGINKCTTANDVWLTVHDADAEENDKAFFKDDQVSFRPAELLAFCREVIRVANAAGQGRREATYPEPAGSAPLVAQPPRDVSELYHELLYAVARKFPGESRHETALRYIRDTEERACEG